MIKRLREQRNKLLQSENKVKLSKSVKDIINDNLTKIVIDFDDFLHKVDYEIVVFEDYVSEQLYPLSVILIRSPKIGLKYKYRKITDRGLKSITKRNGIETAYKWFKDGFLLKDELKYDPKKPWKKTRLKFNIGEYSAYSKKFGVYTYNYWKENIQDDKQEDFWKPDKDGKIFIFNNVIVVRYNYKVDISHDFTWIG